MEENQTEMLPNVAPEPVLPNVAPDTGAPEAGVPNPEAEPKFSGTLFDSIKYAKPEDIPMWIERMGIQDAVYALISAASYGYKKGVYNLLESEIISKSIRILTIPPAQRAPMPPPMAPPTSSEPIVTEATVENEQK